jgi:ABC-type multidrug transport system fused ATPase/permease subunit
MLLVYFLTTGALVPATAVILYNYSNRVNNLIYFCSNMFEKAKDFNLSCSRIFAIMDDKEFPKEKFGKRSIKKLDGNFEFKNVEFGYKDNQILKKLSFKIKSGETVAFVGKSGAGKTTIFNLLCKMYDPQGGNIYMDGIDIDELNKDSIRGNITIISQNPYIFNLSIRDNLRLVKEDLTDEEMIEACKTACLTDFIESLPDKYDTIIGEGGINISGGQKQRLAIARALIQKTKIILFDEATSALDNETQAEIQNAIDNMKGDYTILIIAHRLSTVENSDRILFLDDGKIQASGSKDELMTKSKEFRKLYNSELKTNV